MKIKSEAVHQQIIDAATELILENGIAGTSTVKVAKRINGAQSNIYSYFKSKQALLAGVFAYHQQLLTAALAPVLDAAKPARSQIADIVEALLQFADTHPQSIQLIAAFRAQPDLRDQLPTIADSDVFTALFKQILGYQASGAVKTIPAEFLAEATFSVIADYCNAKLAGEAYTVRLTHQAISGLLADLLLTNNK